VHAPLHSSLRVTSVPFAFNKSPLPVPVEKYTIVTHLIEIQEIYKTPYYNAHQTTLECDLFYLFVNIYKCTNVGSIVTLPV